jgi:hypothetical protein
LSPPCSFPRKGPVFLCYIDESGDEAPLRTRTDPPVFVLGGLIVPAERAKVLLWEFLQLKKDFNPSLADPATRFSDLLAYEIKGSHLRADVRSSSHRRRRRAIGFLDKVFTLLDRHGIRIVAEVHVKGEEGLSQWVYPRSVARLADRFDRHLARSGTRGLMVLDARTKSKNVPSVAAVTTRRFRAGGDLSSLIESPVFGHSDAHAVLQLSDIVVSAVLFPLACAGFCLCLLDNVHPSEQYLALRTRFGHRVRDLEVRDVAPDGTRSNGVRVHDHLNRLPTRALFGTLPVD